MAEYAEYIEKDKVLCLLHYSCDEACSAVVAEIESIPAADVAPVRRGRWEECDWVEPDRHGFGTIRIPKAGLRCNQCANVFQKDLLWKRNFCPNCGARMDAGGQNAD